MTTSGERADTGLAVASIVAQAGNPAAGNDWAVGEASSKQLVAVFAQLVTSAVVANRLPSLKIQDGAGRVAAQIPASSVQAASLTETYVWAVGMPFASGQNVNLVPLPGGVAVGNGWIISTVTTALQAADQWSNIFITFGG